MHRVVLACRTQAKADAATKACQEFTEEASRTAAATAAAARTATTTSDSKSKPPQNLAAAPAYREGGTAQGLECDLADLESVRTFCLARKGKTKTTMRS